MMLLGSKWLYIISPVVLVILILALFSKKSVHTELVIPANAELIWSVLMDTSGYPKWNSVLIPVEGELSEGERLKYKMIQPDGTQSIVGAKVIKVVKEKLLNQFGGIPGLLTFDHRYILEPIEQGTKVTIHEDYRGIGIWFWDAGWVEPAYQKVNESLRERVLQLKEMK